jgi:lipoprotein-anchoring transpeptidase ErfK/SrfK
LQAEPGTQAIRPSGTFSQSAKAGKIEGGYNGIVKKKNLIYLLLVFVIVLLLPISSDVEAAKDENGAQAYYDLPLCLPGYYATQPGDCLPLGPSQTISALREQGFPYPLASLPAAKPDPNLVMIPIRVARIGSNETPVFATLEEAMGGSGTVIRTIPGGANNRYVAMVNQATSGDRTFVQLQSGGWVEATPFYSWPQWQGLEFFATPESDFGWTIDFTHSYNGPSFASGNSGVDYAKYDYFPVYNVVEAEGYEWFQVSPTEWIPSLKARQVVVDTTTPPEVEGGRWINIDLHNQTLAVYDNYELVFASLVATGAGELYSDPGTYRVYEMKELDVMQGSYTSDRSDFYYLEAVPWQIYYNHAQAIHGIYWPAMLGFPQSHGCVNMFPGDAHWLYMWTQVGDYVYVHDPSGKTPFPTPTPMGTPPQELFYPTETPAP